MRRIRIQGGLIMFNLSCRRILVVISLALTLLLTGLAQAELPAISSMIEDEELAHASCYGLQLDQLSKPTITGREMMALLDGIVAFHCEDFRVDEWKNMFSRQREWDQPLTRFDAMAMVYFTAQFLGTGWDMYDAPSLNDAYQRLNFPWDTTYFTEGLFDEFNGQQFTVPIYGQAGLDVAALYYDLFQPSAFSGEFPFPLDGQMMSVHEDDPPSYREGVLAAVRLYESNPAVLQRLKAKWLKEEDWADYDVGVIDDGLLLTDEREAEILSAADARRDAILNSETTIVHADTFIPGETYTGTAYYVSPNGDDNNDGLTPETAWRTVHKAQHETGGESPEVWAGYVPESIAHLNIEEGCVQSGDAVFFERGGIYRLDDLNLTIARPDITISAYGEGPKPIISGSPESGVGEEKWALYYSDDTGKQIWQYCKDMPQTSQVILGDAVACMRIPEWWTGEGYESVDMTHSDYLDLTNFDYGTLTLRGELLSVEDTLTENHTLISRADHTGFEYPIIGGSGAPGPLYVRCDEGNPGAYGSVEFVVYNPGSFIQIAVRKDGIVLDNLSVRHFIWSAVSSGTGVNGDVHNTVIQNCEFAWGGGVLNYDNPVPDNYMMGDCIYCIICDATIRDNYLHDMSSNGVVYEIGENEKELRGFFHLEGNVFDRVLHPVRLDSTFPALQYLDSVQVIDNIIMHAGEGYPTFDGERVALLLVDNHYGEASVQGNTFYLCEENMFSLYDYTRGDDWSFPTWKGNTIVQYADRPLARMGVPGYDLWFPIDTDIIEKAHRVFGEDGAEIYFKLR